MDTETFIGRLAVEDEPVVRLAPPSMRLGLWLSLGLPYVAVIVFMMGPRPDLIAKFADPIYLIEQLAALATGIFAAFAAFASVVPGLDRRMLALPLIPLVVWLGSLGAGCVQAWMQFGPSGLSIQPDWECVPAIVLIGMVPGIAIALMLRRGAPLNPHLTTALGGLAAAGIGNFGLRFFHPQDASIMVLVWQMGTVFLLTALSGWAGKALLDWKSLTDGLRRRIVRL